MHRWSILLLLSLSSAAIYACSGAQAPSNTSATQTCPVIDAGPPPVCPDGCYWAADTKECRKDSSIIMEGVKGDSGAPTPPP